MPSQLRQADAPPRLLSTRFWRWIFILAVTAAVALAFCYVKGWLSPMRLTSAKLLDLLQPEGAHPGFRRNHAKGICVTGHFEGSGALAAYSRASVFQRIDTPVVGRFAIPGGDPQAADASVPIRSMALLFQLPNGEQWRTGMNSMPVFPVSTPQAFYMQLLANRPDPHTGKPDPVRQHAFLAAHPETAAFMAWVKTAKPSSSYVTERYNSINAFLLVDAAGRRHLVRWAMQPETRAASIPNASAGPDYLAADLHQRLATAPQRWHLLVSLALPGDPGNDATKAWPSDRPTIDAGTLVLERSSPQVNGPCRDVNYDPLILPSGIIASDDPLLAARSAVYAASYRRRTQEEAEGNSAATTHVKKGTPP